MYIWKEKYHIYSDLWPTVIRSTTAWDGTIKGKKVRWGKNKLKFWNLEDGHIQVDFHRIENPPWNKIEERGKECRLIAIPRRIMSNQFFFQEQQQISITRGRSRMRKGWRGQKKLSESRKRNHWKRSTFQRK
ncbi:MAG: hypothetical protein Ta2E_09980 [Mycoplasmoidaceae bacterium]|nr:MAG: hypothetical protein Ta2E_09980 [Mycoplasmoidaceae bacterium]